MPTFDGGRHGRALRKLLIFVAFLAAALVLRAQAQGTGEAVVLDIKGAIGPATSDYIVRGLNTAGERGAVAVIIRMDTPGGLDTAMREVIQAILASPVPVVSYVAPSGARAASAGTYISYASHIAAMAPGTNLGAATPVQIGAPGMPTPSPDDSGTRDDKTDGDAKDGETAKSEGDQPASNRLPGMSDKAVNDAVAYIRSLAQLRGRNVEWAEAAVRKAASLSAEEALQQNVIDVIAANIPALLTDIDGREVTVEGRSRRLETKNLAIVTVEPDWRTELLAVITNPNVAYILMLIGIYGIVIEFYSPGLFGPGIIGAICLLLAFYAFHVLPVSYAGLALLLLGLVLMIVETVTPSFGVLGFGGIAAFVIGSVMLMDTTVPGFTVAWELIGSIALAAAVLLLVVLTLLMRSRRHAVVSGAEEMIGISGPVIDWSGTEGRVRVHGETWRARSLGPLQPGSRARVKAIDGLTLIVEHD